MGLSVGPAIGSIPASICSGVTAYHPTVELTCCSPAIDTLMFSSIGYGNDQCRPGPSNALSPSPSGLPNRRMIARSCGPTVKKPEARNTSRRSTITNLTIAKLLRSASASACEPASTGVSGGRTGSGSPLWGWSWSFMAGSLVQQVGRDAPEQVKGRRVLIEDENRALLERAFQRGEAEENPAKEAVFFAIGFEAAAAATAMAVFQAAQKGLKNFSMLISHALVPPAIEALMSSPNCRVQAFLAAGHACVVMGYEEYFPLAKKYRVPIVVTGFEPLDILHGI